MHPRSRKRAARPKAGNKKPKPFGGGVGEDPFFEFDTKRRGRRGGGDDDDVESIESDEDLAEHNAEEEEEGVPEETAGEKRVRVAREHLERIRAIAKRVEEEDGEEEDEEEGREARDGKMNSLVAEILQKEQLEESGRMRRFIASRVLSPGSVDEFRILEKYRQSVTAIALAEDDSRGFSASKDGVILHWDVESGKSENHLWPSEDVLVSHYAKPLQDPSRKRSKNVLALVVSSDGQYLVCGGLDRHVHLWDSRTREHLQGTSQLFSGSFDRTIKLWSAEDRTHMDNLFGHQSEILTISCLRREQHLTIGRDQTMRLWKVPEESQLVFRASASSLECCRFINDNEFLSGSDDGHAGFVNVLAFAKSARFLVAGVDQEPRLGRWGPVSSARNAVAIRSSG